MQHLTLEERERLAYISGDTRTADTLGEILDLQEQIEMLEKERDDALADRLNDSLKDWEQRHGPAMDYYDFFHDCFQHLGDPYPYPEVTLDQDKAVIFDAIRKGGGTAE